MYNFLKKIYKFLTPRKIHYKLENHLRNILYNLFYRGNEYYCEICDTNLKKFITINFTNQTDLLCPKCGSISRTRVLYNYILNNINQNKNDILDFSPHRCIYEKFSKSEKNYTANDFENQFVADTQYDITNLPFKDNSFDLIICFHVLEHVKDDDKAIINLNRILKEKGDVLIQVPIKEGKTDEDFSVTEPKEREKRFGQSDHVRLYGKKDLENKLQALGFNTKIIDYTKKFSANNLIHLGIKEREFFFHCTKKSF